MPRFRLNGGIRCSRPIPFLNIRGAPADKFTILDFKFFQAKSNYTLFHYFYIIQNDSREPYARSQIFILNVFIRHKANNRLFISKILQIRKVVIQLNFSLRNFHRIFPTRFSMLVYNAIKQEKRSWIRCNYPVPQIIL